MEIKEIHNKKSEVIADVICDCCGKSCKVFEGKITNEERIDNGEPYYDFEFLSLKTNWGHHSKKDDEIWTAQICEKCVDEKFQFIKFKKA